jgi:predicted Fe-Mo cluster-binding NifX family protein
MKLLIPSEGKNLNDILSSRFGKSNYFIVYDTETINFEVIDKDEIEDNHPGKRVASLAFDKDIDIVLTLNIGRDALAELTKLEIKVYRADIDMTVKEAIVAFQKKELIPILIPGEFGKHFQPFNFN